MSSTEILTEEESTQAAAMRRICHFMIDECPEADMMRIMLMLTAQLPDIPTF